MKSYARIGLSCLLAAMLMSPLMACGSKEGESSGPKKRYGNRNPGTAEGTGKIR